MSNPSNPSIAETFKAGDKLAGCYTLKENLPSQGLCIVWLAHDEELNKDIVLHFVPDPVATDSRAMSELKQETKRNRQLIHPRIVRVHDLVEDEKWAAISMDYIQGETLAALQQKHEKGAFNPSELAAGISEICQTLEDAHRIDLFHRDLVPENLLVTANGIMVQKFGISRVILDSVVRSGQPIKGSRDTAYVSPQQLDGGRAGRADDIYSLGAALYDLLTGAPPFSEGEIVPQIRKDIPPLVSARRAAKEIAGEPIPTAWDETTAACLAKTPDERPKSAAEAASRFTAVKSAEAPVSPIAEVEAAAAAAAVAATAATLAEAKTAAKAEPEVVKDAPAPPEQEAVGKSPKRPWSSGPGKTPVIAEATVLSKTPVPKGESASETTPEEPAAGGGAKKGGPGGATTPTGFPLRAFVEVEGDSKPGKGKSPAGLVIGGVVAIILIVAYMVAKNSGGSGNPAPENSAAATTGSSASSASPAVAEASSPAPSPVNLAATGTPASAEPASSAPPVVAESPTPTPVPIAIASLAALTDAQANQLVEDKTKAVDQAKAALANAEKAAKEKADQQALAASAVQQVQATIKQKADAATAAKKAATATAAALKQQQDSLAKAETEAAEAQKAAAAKTQAADQIRKAVEAAQMAAQQQQTTQQQAQADAEDATKAEADRQKAADAAAKAATDAAKARAQQAQALAQAQADLGQVQAGLQQAQQSHAAEKARKAADEAARIQKEREEETTRLAAQAAIAAKAAEDAQKALDAAKKAVADAEKAQREAEAQAEAARNGSLPMGSPAPSPASAAPTATPPAGAAASPAASAPTLSIRAPNPHMKVDQALINSLGMRFAPVGNVFFSVWLTRVQDFEAFANATGYKGDMWRNPGFNQSPDHPVVNVSWNDANQFCLWLTEKEHHEGILTANQTYRLPTDLEWSNAVGLSTESGRTPESRDMDIPDVYPWGTQWPPPAGAGNYTGEETDSDVAIKGYNDGFAWTSPVGSFTPNKFGLFDMGGNVWEWCLDWWNSEQNAKVLRGGSWDNGALKLSLLSSCRIRANADKGMDNYGFRVILSQEMTKEKSAKHHAP